MAVTEDRTSEAGMEHIKFVMEAHRKEQKYVEPPKRVVGGFGIVHPDGRTDMLCWVVSNRKDRRHGVVGKKEPVTRYAKEMYESMFRNW